MTKRRGCLEISYEKLAELLGMEPEDILSVYDVSLRRNRMINLDLLKESFTILHKSERYKSFEIAEGQETPIETFCGVPIKFETKSTQTLEEVIRLHPELKPFTSPEEFFKFYSSGTCNQPLSQRQIEVMNSNKPLRIIQSARRQGKTQLIAAEVFYKSLMETNKNFLIGAPTKHQAEEIFRRVKQLFDATHLNKQQTRNCTSPVMEIGLHNGSRIRVIPVRGVGWCGQEADYVYLDDAELIHEEEWKSIEPYIMGNNKLLLTVTPPPMKSINDYPTLKSFYKILPVNTDNVSEGFFHWPMVGEQRRKFEDSCKATMPSETFWTECLGDW